VKTRGDYGFKTFVSRPIFVDHNNTDPKRTRGVIVDSLLHIEPSNKRRASFDYYSSAPQNHAPETWVELLLEIDAKQFPRLAAEIKNGDIDSVSMGCNVEETECSICSNRASTIDQYCAHVQSKGQKFSTDDGHEKLAYEDCYGVNFFEISLVFDPADETALVTAPVIAKTAKPGSLYKESPAKSKAQFRLMKGICEGNIDHPDISKDVACEFVKNHQSPKGLPEKKDSAVKTPENEKTRSVNKRIADSYDLDSISLDDSISDGLCPECNNPVDLSDGKCNKCGFSIPPEGLDDPDLNKAKDVKERKARKRLDRSVNSTMKTTMTFSRLVDEAPDLKRLAANGWDILATPNPRDKNEKTLTEDGRPATDEPSGKRVIEDQLVPVTTRKRRSMKKKALGEMEPGDAGKEETPQNNEDSTPIKEHQPGTQETPYPTNSEEEPMNSEDSAPIKEHQPGTQSLQYKKKEDNEPQDSEDAAGMTEHHPDSEWDKGNPGQTHSKAAADDAAEFNDVFGGDDDSAPDVTVDEDDIDVSVEDEGDVTTVKLDVPVKVPTLHAKAVETLMFEAMKLVDDELTYGITKPEEKWARIAQVQAEGMPYITASREMLKRQKTAGVLVRAQKRARKVAGASSLPPLSGLRTGSATEATATPDEALFS
jgi:hypothetical protein